MKNKKMEEEDSLDAAIGGILEKRLSRLKMGEGEVRIDVKKAFAAKRGSIFRSARLVIIQLG